MTRAVDLRRVDRAGRTTLEPEVSLILQGETRYPTGMPNVGPWEVILLLLLALLLFGAKRLPEIGRSVGKGLREFKDSVSGKDEERAELPVGTQDTTAPAQQRERDTVP